MRRTSNASVSTRAFGAIFAAARTKGARVFCALMTAALVASLTVAPAAVAQPEAGPEQTEDIPAPPVPSASDRAPEELPETAQENAGQKVPTFKPADKEPGPHKVVEGLEEARGLRTAGMKVFKVPGGGAHIAQVFTGPVHFQNEQGEWREIDTSVNEVEGGFSNGPNAFDVFLPDRLGDAAAVETSLDGGKIAVSLAGAGSSKARPGSGARRVPQRVRGRGRRVPDARRGL